MGRGPRGPCGLKFSDSVVITMLSSSRPARALWIEIALSAASLACSASRPARALWIEIFFSIK